MAAATGVPAGTLRTAATLVASPLWFLLPYAALTVAAGGAVPVPAPVTVLAAWLVSWVLGVTCAGGRLAGRRTPWVLALGGALAVGLFVLVGGYPASAVGVPGGGRSNLHPPSPVAVSLAVAQVGVALLARPWLDRVRWPPPAALPVYLWHQSALVAVTAVAARLAGRLPGLHTAPDGVGWLLRRAAWLPVFAVALALALTLHPRSRGRGCPARDGRVG